MVKSADNTTLGGLICIGVDYRRQVASRVKQSELNNHVWNVDKTEEMIIDFGKEKGQIHSIVINTSNVEIEECFKFLLTFLMNTLSWTNQVYENLKGPETFVFFFTQTEIL